MVLVGDGVTVSVPVLVGRIVPVGVGVLVLADVFVGLGVEVGRTGLGVSVMVGVGEGTMVEKTAIPAVSPSETSFAYTTAPWQAGSRFAATCIQSSGSPAFQVRSRAVHRQPGPAL